MRCKNGHNSDEPDYCSVCGVAMSAAASSASPPAPAQKASSPSTAATGTAGAAGSCPSCGEPRVDVDARFCEVCRYDFVAKGAGPPPAARQSSPNMSVSSAAPRPPNQTPLIPKAAPGPPSVVKPSAAGAASKVIGPVQWELVVSIDQTLDTEPDPGTPCPAGAPERVYPMDQNELLVGRQDDRRDIHPEIELIDPGASRRHAKFVRMADGGAALQDLASTNGTKLNDTDVAPGSRHVLKEGDSVTIGRWTRIVLRGRA